MKFLFVGDTPSTKNKDTEVAFEGTKSYGRLLEWISILDIKEYDVCNSHNNKERIKITEYKRKGYRFIALGNKASEVLINMKIDHHKLPHPSFRNISLNDTEFVKEKLNACKVWLNGLS